MTCVLLVFHGFSMCIWCILSKGLEDAPAKKNAASASNYSKHHQETPVNHKEPKTDKKHQTTIKRSFNCHEVKPKKYGAFAKEAGPAT